MIPKNGIIWYQTGIVSMTFLLENIKIENYRGRIRLRWNYNRERYTLSFGKDYNTQNLSKAQLLAANICSDINSENFDYSLNRYKALREFKKIGNEGYLGLYDNWVNNIQHQDINNNSNYYNLRSALVKANVKNFKDVIKVLIGVSPDAYNRRLRVLKKFSKWLYKNAYITYDPLLEFDKKPLKRKRQELREPFSLEEISKILEAIKSDIYSGPRYKHSHYYPFFYFVFRTGVRNQEAIGLSVKNIDFSKRVIEINQVLARNAGKSFQRRFKEPKNDRVRIIPLTDDLAEILLPLTTNKKPDALVFTTQEGKVIDDHNLQRRTFYPVLDKLKIQKRNLYAVRHSFGSRALEQGMNILAVSNLMGNSPQTLLKHYAKIINKPADLPNM